MKSHIRNSAIVIALLASGGVASAQSPTSPTAPAPAAKSQDSMKQSGSLQMSAQQKTAIFQSVTKEKLKSPPPANLPGSVGAPIPASIELYALPANIVSEVPAAKSYKYTVAQNQVVI